MEIDSVTAAVAYKIMHKDPSEKERPVVKDTIKKSTDAVEISNESRDKYVKLKELQSKYAVDADYKMPEPILDHVASNIAKQFLSMGN